MLRHCKDCRKLKDLIKMDSDLTYGDPGIRGGQDKDSIVGLMTEEVYRKEVGDGLKRLISVVVIG